MTIKHIIFRMHGICVSALEKSKYIRTGITGWWDQIKRDIVAGCNYTLTLPNVIYYI